MSNIQVVVRCRSRNAREVHARSPIIVELPNDRFSLVDPYITINHQITSSANSQDLKSSSPIFPQRTYKVDQVYGSQADQSLIFNNVALPLFNDFLSGFNVTILAYGQTGTGKTFTMCGNDPDITKFETNDESIGIIPRILRLLFERLDEIDVDYIVKCSYLELYNEELKDLLQDETSGRPLKIYEQGNKSGKSIKIQNLCEFPITDYKQGFKYLKIGLDKRKTSSTKLNDVSSRSHAIFTISLYKNEGTDSQGDSQGDSQYHIAKMNLVDLAGSENISRSGSIVKETGSINQSLLTLGRVINTLSEQKSNSHIPYRESKLTRLLQDSIGGNTKTTLIATISPAKVNIDETCSTLDYASKAKNIKNAPQMGHESESIMKKTLVKNLSAEIVRLNSDLIATRNKNGIYLDSDNYSNLIQENEALKTSLKESQLKHESVEFKLQELKESNKQEIEKLIARLNRVDAKNKQLMNQNSVLLNDVNEKQLENEELRQKLNRISIQMTHSSDKLAKILFENLNSSILTIKETITKDNQKHNIEELINTQKELVSQFQKYTQDIESKIKLSNNKVHSLVKNDLVKLLDSYKYLFDRISIEQREYFTSFQQQISQLKTTITEMENYLSTDKLDTLRSNISQGVNELSQQVFSEFKDMIVKSIDEKEKEYKRKLCSKQMEIIGQHIDQEREILQEYTTSWEQALNKKFPAMEQQVINHDNNIQSCLKTVTNISEHGKEHIDKLLTESGNFSISDIPQPKISKLELISKNLTNENEKLVQDLHNVKDNLSEIELFDARNAFKISPIKPIHSPNKKRMLSSPVRDSPTVSKIVRSSTTVGVIKNRNDTKIPKLNRSRSFEENKKRKILQELNNL